MLWQEAPEDEQNFSMVMRVLEYAEVKEENEEYVSPLDLLFQAMEREKPDSVAVRQYKVFKLAAGKMHQKCLRFDCYFQFSFKKIDDLDSTVPVRRDVASLVHGSAEHYTGCLRDVDNLV